MTVSTASSSTSNRSVASGRDHAIAGALAAVGELGRDDEAARAADFHAGDALLPAADHVARTEVKGKRLTALARTVELAAPEVFRVRVVEPAGVVDDDDHAREGLVADALHEVGHEDRRFRRRSRGRRGRWRRSQAARRARSDAIPQAARAVDEGDRAAQRRAQAEVGGRGRFPCASKMRQSLKTFEEGTVPFVASHRSGSQSPGQRPSCWRSTDTKSSISSNSWAIRSTVRPQRSEERREWLAPFVPGTSPSAAKAPRAFSAQVL